MKKLIALLLTFVFVFTLVACNEAENDASSVAESTESSIVSDISAEASTDVSVEESLDVSVEESSKESVEASQEESTEESTEESNGESSDEPEEDENATESFKVGKNTVNIIEDEETGYKKLSVTYADSTKQTLCEDYNIYDIAASADNRHLMFCVYEWEEYGDIYLLNFENKKLTKLPLYDAAKDHVPYQAIWLDDEYIIYSDIMNAGTIAIGGDVFVYDVVSGMCKKIIATPEDWRLQITNIQCSVSGLRFVCGYYDESFNKYEELSFDLTRERVKELIDRETALSVEYSNGSIKESDAKEELRSISASPSHPTNFLPIMTHT